MTPVDATTGEVLAEMTPDAARILTDRIKVAVEATWHLVTEAYQSRAWSALGYSSWDDYCTREFGTSRLRLPREERQEVVASLRESGLSIRAIAAATGEGYGTVRRELEREPIGSPEAEDGSAPYEAPSAPAPRPVTGTDGKSYPAPAPRPAPAAPARPRRNPLGEQARTAGWELRKAVERMQRLASDDRFPSNKEQVAAEWSGHLTNAITVCQDLLDGLTTEPQEAQ